MLKLAKRREAAGCSQARLAKRIGIGQASLCRWETGRRVPHDVMLKRWLHVLGQVERESARRN